MTDRCAFVPIFQIPACFLISDFFCNFAESFTKSDEHMTIFIIAIHELKSHVQNYAFKENWKSTAGYAIAHI